MNHFLIQLNIHLLTSHRSKDPFATPSKTGWSDVHWWFDWCKEYYQCHWNEPHTPPKGGGYITGHHWRGVTKLGRVNHARLNVKSPRRHLANSHWVAKGDYPHDSLTWHDDVKRICDRVCDTVVSQKCWLDEVRDMFWISIQIWKSLLTWHLTQHPYAVGGVKF